MREHDAPLAYSAREAAKALCVSERTVWTLIERGELQTFKLGARTLIRAEELRALIDRKAALGSRMIQARAESC